MTNGTTLLTNLHARRRASLDGRWKAIVDPYDFGYEDIFGQPNKRGYFRDQKARHAGDRIEYDFDRSFELSVPGDWNTQRPELLYYEGTVWYRTIFDGTGFDDTAFDRAAESSGRTFLSVGAANHTTRVFLDGVELAVHEGGFGPFAVELTGRVGPGSHSLVLMVDNRRRPERIPAMRADWWNFGGITRSVDLVHVPDTFLRDAWITMAPDGSIVGGVEVVGADLNASVEVELVDLGLRSQIEIGLEQDSGDEAGTGSALVRRGRFELATADQAGAEVERWAPGRPVLHRVRFAITTDEIADDITDEIADEVGFRTVRTEGTKILVNDEPLFLRGISLHGEGPSGGRRAHGDDDAATLLGWAADLGANFVRLAHYQHDEAMVRTADRLGLLAWCEVPVYWGIDFTNQSTLANGIEQVVELVTRDRSRAAVALWSIANETPPAEGRNEFLTALAAEVRRLDPTRLVTAALYTHPTSDRQMMVDDPLGETVDVIGVNQYLGWYYGDRADIAETGWTSPFAKPIVFSELGAGAQAGRHGSEDEIWTEEFQAAVYREQLAMIERCDDCAGLSPWILKDFRTPIRNLPGIQDGYNRKGLVSEEGVRKLAFETVRAFYS